MSVYHNSIKINTVMGRPSYHDIREELLETVNNSNIKDGLLTVSSAHNNMFIIF